MGKLAECQELGDVLFYNADQGRSASRATAEREDAARHHLDGSWYDGTWLGVGQGTDKFVKNARRRPAPLIRSGGTIGTWISIPPTGTDLP